MEWTEQILIELKNCGMVLYDVEVTATCLQIDKAELIEALNDKDSAAHQSYFAGYYQSEMERRKMILKQAKDGSNQAQILAKKMADECDKSNKINGIYGN